MKSFIYKIIISVIAVILIYEFTIGKQISKYSNQISAFTSKEGRKEGVNKIREEINKGIKKERYLSKEDAKLINSFLNKIKKELEEANQNYSQNHKVPVLIFFLRKVYLYPSLKINSQSLGSDRLTFLTFLYA